LQRGIPERTLLMCRVGQNHIYTPYMTVYLVISLPKILCVHPIRVALANPTRVMMHCMAVRNELSNWLVFNIS
jgi:hypothetical protein